MAGWGHAPLAGDELPIVLSGAGRLLVEEHDGDAAHIAPLDADVEPHHGPAQVRAQPVQVLRLLDRLLRHLGLVLRLLARGVDGARGPRHARVPLPLYLPRVEHVLVLEPALLVLASVAAVRAGAPHPHIAADGARGLLLARLAALPSAALEVVVPPVHHVLAVKLGVRLDVAAAAPIGPLHRRTRLQARRRLRRGRRRRHKLPPQPRLLQRPRDPRRPRLLYCSQQWHRRHKHHCPLPG
mmetsp:Transcript_44655/g.113026  ORF Transcript_44655/g.113026 Transcript_44655/m.113026 type:complete len:240 (+) Transcript_44655:523-1242(+)